MSVAQTMELIDELVKAKIPKRTATKLIDYVESQNGKAHETDIQLIKRDIRGLKWVIGIGFVVLTSLTIAAISIPFYLHSDTKENMQAMESRNIERHKELKALIREKR